MEHSNYSPLTNTLNYNRFIQAMNAITCIMTFGKKMHVLINGRAQSLFLFFYLGLRKEMVCFRFLDRPYTNIAFTANSKLF